MDGHAIYILIEERTDIGRKTKFVSEHVNQGTCDIMVEKPIKEMGRWGWRREESSRLEIWFWKSLMYRWQWSPSGLHRLSTTSTSVAHVTWKVASSSAQLVLVARQELFSISYGMFLILLVMN